MQVKLQTQTSQREEYTEYLEKALKEAWQIIHVLNSMQEDEGQSWPRATTFLNQNIRYR